MSGLQTKGEHMYNWGRIPMVWAWRREDSMQWWWDLVVPTCTEPKALVREDAKGNNED